MNEAEGADVGRVPLAIGVVAAGSAVCLAGYFVVGGPLGTLNDLGNAATGVLSAALAWRLRRELSGSIGTLATALAIAGAAVTVIGSALVVSGTTGFLLAGLVSSVGFAAIGTWVVTTVRRSAWARAWPRRLRVTGLVAGALMATGIAALPGIGQRLDDVSTAPGWVWIGFLGWLGIYVLYPAWAIGVGVREARAARRMDPVALPSA